MCGITGILDRTAASSSERLERLATAMARTLEHRGPDDEGVWSDPAAGIALASRRLAILDLSAAGHQPMLSAGGRYAIAFNGEVYNFEAVRDELPPESRAALRGHSDTEVVLAAIEKWGVASALPRFNGMFAFALWDGEERSLTLARDRMGEKPLYYGWFGEVLLFGSELKALRAHPAFGAEIDRDALALYMQHSAVPAPYSIYRGIWKLPPASYAVLRAGAREPEVATYWSVAEAVNAGSREPFTGSEVEAVEQLDALLRDAVRLRMISDVPLGAFLSGGIDSSTIVALMQAQSSRPVKTFSIGSADEAYNEAKDAQAVARHLKTEHTELYVTARETLDVLPQMPRFYDEPFADPSIVPTYLVARLAKRDVTVSLSGDGGDEIFGGYNRHLWTPRLWRGMRWMPRPLRRAVGAVLTAVPASRWQTIADALGKLSPEAQQRVPGYKIHKLANVLDARDLAELYRGLATHWREPVVKGAAELPTALSGTPLPRFTDFVEQMMYLDTVTYLPDDILVKLDRATMAVSLEGRVPLLDHRVVEFAWRLPLRMRVRGTTGKWALRQVLYKYVPHELVDRPKMGFGVPLGEWLRGPLRDWAEALLDKKRLREEGYFEPQLIRDKWEQHLAGKGSWAYHLWDALMFQAWLAENAAAPRGNSARVPS
jgi:asparagine synthase (glutamine-hydrolysing)